MSIKPKSIKHYNVGELEDLILRDYLAADRTVLANERTFLAYVRTSLTALVVGVSTFKFFDSIITDLIGSICIVGAFILAVIGTIRYKEIRNIVRELKQKKDQVKKMQLITLKAKS